MCILLYLLAVSPALPIPIRYWLLSFYLYSYIFFLQGFYAVYNRIFRDITKEELAVQRLRTGAATSAASAADSSDSEEDSATAAAAAGGANGDSSSLSARTENDALPPFGDAKSDYETVSARLDGWIVSY